MYRVLQFLYLGFLIGGLGGGYIHAQEQIAPDEPQEKMQQEEAVPEQERAEESFQAEEKIAGEPEATVPVTKQAPVKKKVEEPAPAEAVPQVEPEVATVPIAQPATEIPQPERAPGAEPQTQQGIPLQEVQPVTHPSVETKQEAHTPVELISPVKMQPEAPKIQPVQPVAPEKSQEKTFPEPHIEEIEGIDTVDLEEPRGNWLFKRIWWERAERKYEKIRAMVASIFEMRMQFFKERSRLDREVFDPFYVEIGLSQGELQETIDELMKKLEQERQRIGDLDPEERALLEKIHAERKSLEQVKRDVTAINQLDTDVEASINKLLDQINRARNYEREAWEYFKEIARVLSDKKARELYHAMDIISQNIKDIQEYVESAFASHFKQVIFSAQTQVEKTKNEIAVLKEKGIDMQKEAERLVAAYAAALEKPTPYPAVEDQAEEEAVEEAGFIGSIFAYIGGAVKTVWHGIVYIITWPFAKLFGPSEVYEQEEPTEVVSQQYPELDTTEEELAA